MKGKIYYTFVLYALKTMLSSKSLEVPNSILTIMPTKEEDLYVISGFSKSKIDESGTKIIEAVDRLRNLLKLETFSIDLARLLYSGIYQELSNFYTEKVLNVKEYCECVNERIKRFKCDFAINQKMILVYLKKIGIIDSLSYNMNDANSVVYSEEGKIIGFSLVKKIGYGKPHTYYAMEMDEQAQDFLNKCLWDIFYDYFASNPLNYIRNNPEGDVELTGETFKFISAVKKKVTDSLLESIKKLEIPNEILEYFEMLNMDTGD